MTTGRSACCDCLLFSCDIYKLFIMTQRDPGPHHRSGDHRVEIPRILLDHHVKKHSCSTVQKYTYMCGMCVRDIVRVSVCVCVTLCVCPSARASAWASNKQVKHYLVDKIRTEKNEQNQLTLEQMQKYYERLN